MKFFIHWSVKWTSVKILQNGQKFWKQEFNSFPKWYDTGKLDNFRIFGNIECIKGQGVE